MSTVYNIELKHIDQSDNICLSFPDELMDEMGWVPGDDLKFIDHKDGSFSVKKINYETVELELDDEELFKYMQKAHELGMSFNEFVVHVIEEHLNVKE
ncbi:hypothetical protein CL634_02690 [bacterium]|nr:hypothetical protein [bacterium]|tara:strand:- start:711 stop:1004 length:294 start_codon:yes stop_codon:yes gene_type:complete